MDTRRQEDPSRLPSSPLTPEPALASILHQELPRLGVGKMLFECGSQILQPTALVNDSYLRLGSEFDSMLQGRTRVPDTLDRVMRLKRDWTMACAWLCQQLST
jgi:hypothetical protein